jgi:hypothetical protein
MQKKITELVLAPRARVIWLALAGFFLGSALCPFNPPTADEPSSISQGETMNSAPERVTNTENKHFEHPIPSTGEIETATFALG